MSRPQSPYLLLKRGKYYYYRLPGQKTFHSTSQTTKSMAQEFVIDILNKGIITNKNTIRTFCRDFYIYDKCSYVKRLLKSGKSIGRRHCKNKRLLLEKYIFTDPIADKKLANVNRGDIFDFQNRLLNKKISESTVNKTIGVLKKAFNEAIFREQINRNPTSLVDNLKYQKKEKGIFKIDELKKIFPENNLGPWESELDYTCFFLTFMTGMRRGEVLALKWNNINLKEKYIEVIWAWKSNREIDSPKWNHTRTAPMPDILIDKLTNFKLSQLKLMEKSLEDELVFCYPNGQRLGETYWRRHFSEAMRRAQINYIERNITPHSFRHTLNTLLQNEGYSNEKIKATLGWVSDKVQNNYTHFKPEHLGGQGIVIDNLWKK